LSPTSTTVNEEDDIVISEGFDAAEYGGMECENDFVNEAGAQHAISAALEDIWSGLHHDDDDAEEEHDENPDHEGAGEEGGDIEGEDADGWKLYDNWDDRESGLSALDTLGEDFEHNAIADSECRLGSTHILIYRSNAAGKLSECDMSVL